MSNLPGGFKTRGLRVKGDDTPISPAEFREAIVLKGNAEQAEELADCFLLLFKAAHLTGFNVADIEAAMAKKLIELHRLKHNNRILD